MTSFRHLPSFSPDGKEMLVTIASGPVIIQDGKVLLDKHEDDFWKFPGGAVLDNESFQEAAVREVQEELNIEVQITGEPYVVSFVREKDGKQELVILIHYKGAIVSGEPTPCRDVTEFAWHDMNDLPKDCAPNIKAVVEYFKSRII